MAELAEELILLFDKEIKETYFIKIHGKKPGGLLYSSYYNLQSKLAKDKRLKKNQVEHKENFSFSANLAEILQEFPILKQSFGYKLIEADFAKLYPGIENSFTEKWEHFQDKVLPIFKSNIKEQQSLVWLKTYDVQSNDAKNALTLFLLHGLLVPTNRGKKNSQGKKLLKFTIEDSRTHNMRNW
ncbi:uncharacterized protein [Drosophila takahashii]|uniref:uncharacterized protein n=1 Tax=Drosophila takahashii TaxID=29030 RepID=UPI00389945AC